MKHLGCIGSGNKLQKQREGLGSLGDRKTEVMCLGERKKRREGEGVGMLLGGRAPELDGLKQPIGLCQSTPTF